VLVALDMAQAVTRVIMAAVAVVHPQSC